MRAKARRVLSVAVRTGRMACILLDGGELVFWATSRKAAKTKERAATKFRKWIEEFRPDLLVTENPDCAGQKRGAQIKILKILFTVAEDQPIPNIAVCREKRFRNAYLDAEEFGRQFPDISHLVPKKPPIWKGEPYQLACFEALAMARDAGILEAQTDDPE
jgi:hypothetical protein